MPLQSDILVCGAGPAGLACAIALQQRGLNVTIVDQLAKGLNGSRAVVVHAYTLELLASIGVADRLNEIGIQATRLRPCDQYDRPLVEVDFGVLKHDTPYPFALFIAQHDVERVLEEHFEALGGNVLRGWKLTGLEQRSHLSYPLIARFEGGESIATKYAVGTDGSKSAIRTLSGIPFPDPLARTADGRTDLGLQVVLADIFLKDPLPEILSEPNQIHPILGNGSFMLLVPINSTFRSPEEMRGKHFYRMVASVPPSAPQPEHSPNQAFLQAILDTRGPGSHTGGPTAQIDEVWMSSRYRPRNALADRFYMPLGAGHIMLAGDAAHVHSPAGGQGMNISLADGILLAGAIQETIENGNAKPLEEWNKERRAVAREMITVTTGLTRFTNQPSWFMVVLRWTMRFIMWIPGVQRRMLWRSSGLIYRK